MQVQKTFYVVGEKVEVMVTGEMTRGASMVVIQTSPPGGGPPPHRHELEDEVFTVLEGDYEIFDGEQWTALATGESYFAARGGIHAFRNRGTTVGRLQAVVAPAGLEFYLEKLSTLVLPRDVAAAHELSEGYGVQLFI